MFLLGKQLLKSRRACATVFKILVSTASCPHRDVLCPTSNANAPSISPTSYLKGPLKNTTPVESRLLAPQAQWPNLSGPNLIGALMGDLEQNPNQIGDLMGDLIGNLIGDRPQTRTEPLQRVPSAQQPGLSTSSPSEWNLVIQVT